MFSDEGILTRINSLAGNNTDHCELILTRLIVYREFMLVVNIYQNDNMMRITTHTKYIFPTEDDQVHL